MILKFKNFKGRVLSFVLFALVAASAVFSSAQEIPNDIFGYLPGKTLSERPTPRPTPPVTKPKTAVVPTPPVDKNKEKIKEKYKESTAKRPILNEEDTPAEKSVAVSPNVVVNLCVSEGTIRINGWERNEIRAYVGNGSQVGFQIQQKDKASGNPVMLKILGFDPAKNDEANAEECLSGDEIEVDVPRGAYVIIKGAECDTTIESVKRVSVDMRGGDIFLNDIKFGIFAKTYYGDITVGKSSGAIMLDTSNGNIVAYEVSPSEIGDVFKAKTINGLITLQHIEHMQAEVNSTSGSIRFTSAFLSGGQYSFSTQSGSILLAIPEKSSCRIVASYGGQFNSEIPLQNQKISSQGSVKNLTGQIGGGEAALNLTTYIGRILIRKQ
jgi:hypothetical protein